MHFTAPAVVVLSACTSIAVADVAGPADAPPGGVVAGMAGESPGHDGGLTLEFSGFDQADIDAGLYYGKSSNAPVVGAMDWDEVAPGVALDFQGVDGLAARWAGQTQVFVLGGAGFEASPVEIRISMTAFDDAGEPMPWLNPLDVDAAFPAAADAVVQVTGDFSVNVLHEAFWGGVWQPVNPLYDALQTNPARFTLSSFDDGFYGDVAPPPPACPADLDGSGVVDSVDLNTLLAGFGCTPGGAACLGDVDGDGDADSTDLNIILADFGTTCG